MDIQGANTEPYYRFLRANEDFGSNIKLAYGALHAIRQKESRLIRLPTGGEPWGRSTKWRAIKQRIPQVRRFLAQMGLVLVTSAFEDFLTNVKSEHNRYSGFLGVQTIAKGPLAGDIGNGDILHNFYASLGWDIKPIKYLLPLLDYFVLARNCIVHRSGRASEALVVEAGSSGLRDCIRAWPSKPGKTIPQLPDVQEGGDIPFLPRHAILFSEVCQRAAVEIDSLLSGFLGVEGIVYMAAYHALLADDRIRTIARRSPEQVINHILAERCHVPIPDKYEVISILKKLDIWKQCRSKYNKLYPNAK
jgi:hypothetical protein